MEGRKRLARLIPDCYNPVQDEDGVIHFFEDDDILLDYDFVEEWVCSQCWGRTSYDCEDEICVDDCVRHELVDRVRFAVRLLNCAMTDLCFGVWAGSFDKEMKEYNAGNNNA